MKRTLVTVATIILGVFAAASASADTSVITSSDEARVAAGSAAYQVSASNTASAQPRLPAVLTTTDELRVAHARAQYRVLPGVAQQPRRAPAMLITSSDEARLAIGLGQRSVTELRAAAKGALRTSQQQLQRR